eukprot:CAMPEP_0172320756 /NCGR_PEP_ID=MMETSP1058-20130122/41339_1 /TAXON_ID=83371 /ORGANISM="Detonula confervacea, Strain CCMP 353" /LENGTH=254 /DNA_ID=CAMNT_0013036085 /DNA_START=205 /DNA_END=966 /DNA_ORIENTATION=+
MRFTNTALVTSLLQQSPLLPTTPSSAFSFSSIPRFPTSSQRATSTIRDPFGTKSTVTGANDAGVIAGNYARVGGTSLYMSELDLGDLPVEDISDIPADVKDKKAKGNRGVAASILGVATATKAFAAGALGLAGAAGSVGDINVIQDAQQNVAPSLSGSSIIMKKQSTPLETKPFSTISLPGNLLLADAEVEGESIIGNIIENRLADIEEKDIQKAEEEVMELKRVEQRERDDVATQLKMQQEKTASEQKARDEA